MATEIPLVRHLIACREIVVTPDNRDMTLRSVIHAVVCLPGESFPMRMDVALYAILTNGRGEFDFSVRFTYVERGEDGTQGEEEVVGTSPAVRIDLGQDPSAVHGLPIRRIRLPFPKAGQYALYLLCDGQPIAHEYLEARLSHDAE